jgi:hypothetical protein
MSQSIIDMNKPEKKVWKLDTNERRARAVAVLNSVPIGPDQPMMQLTLEIYRKNRSAAQQAIMWIWHKQWFEHFGNAVNEEHIRFKKEYLLPLLLRDNVIDGLYELYRDATMRQVEAGDQGGLNALYHLITTNALNTKQFAEILTEYEREAAMEGCAFTVLGPEYEEAMGK